jgi:tetratricopeptide (TPR) repeat protein
MKNIAKTLFALTLLSLFCLNGFAKDLPSANKAFADGDFESAKTQYQDLLKADPNNPYLHYDLGNAYFKLGKLGKATASYYRAYRLLPRNSDIRYNLSLALKRSGQKLVPEGIPDMVHRLYNWFSYSELRGIMCFFIWILAIAFALRLTLLKKNPALDKTISVSLILIAAFGIWTFAKYLTRLKNPVVTIDPSAEIKSGPGMNFLTSATVPEGHILELVDAKDDWAFVVSKEKDVSGWIKNSEVEKI